MTSAALVVVMTAVTSAALVVVMTAVTSAALVVGMTVCGVMLLMICTFLSTRHKK